MALTAPEAVSLQTIGAIHNGNAGRNMARLPDGTLMLVERDRGGTLNPLWYSEDDGSTWTNATFTPTSYITAYATRACQVWVLDNDDIVLAYGGDGGIRVTTITHSGGGSFSNKYTQSINAGGGFYFNPKGLVCFLHPDQSTYPGEYFVFIPYAYTGPSNNNYIWQGRYNPTSGFTQVQNVVSSSGISPYYAEQGGQVVLQASTVGGDVPDDPASPTIWVSDILNSSSITRCEWTWGTVSLSATGITRTTSSSNLSSGFSGFSVLWDGTNYRMFIRSSGDVSVIQELVFASASDVSPASTTTVVDLVDSAHAFRAAFASADGAERLIIVDERNTAGIQYKVTSAGSWGTSSSYSTYGSGTEKDASTVYRMGTSDAMFVRGGHSSLLGVTSDGSALREYVFLAGGQTIYDLSAGGAPSAWGVWGT